MAYWKINVFQQTDTEEYLRAAIETAEWIKKQEITDEKGKRKFLIRRKVRF